MLKSLLLLNVKSNKLPFAPHFRPFPCPRNNSISQKGTFTLPDSSQVRRPKYNIPADEIKLLNFITTTQLDLCPFPSFSGIISHHPPTFPFPSSVTAEFALYPSFESSRSHLITSHHQLGLNFNHYTTPTPFHPSLVHLISSSTFRSINNSKSLPPSYSFSWVSQVQQNERLCLIDPSPMILTKIPGMN